MITESTTKQPDVDQGWIIINRFNAYAPLWIKSIKKKTGLQQFRSIFKEPQLSKHLFGKYLGYLPDGFAGFFLNTDYRCQEKMLQVMFNGDIDFTYPEFADWKSYLPKDWNEDDFDIKTARTVALIKGNKTKWDLYPHDILFINKFLLYANNNGIDGYEFDESIKKYFTDYKGEKYGNFPNWNKFWNSQSHEVQEAIVEKLVTYN